MPRLHPIRNTIILLFAIIFFVAIPLWLAVTFFPSQQSYLSPATLVDNLKLSENETAEDFFSAYNYDLDRIRTEKTAVPNLFLSRLPAELPNINNSNERKKLFISTLLPPILKVNQYIKKNRQKLIQIMDQIESGTPLSRRDQNWSRTMMTRYKVDDQNYDKLLKRMDIIPPSLALTQAAIESGWGTSRFAQKGNALYGQWTWAKEGGLVPLERQAGKRHKIKIFDNVIGSVEGYALNLNRHPAYARFRHQRSLDQDNVNAMLETLDQYSELGYEYVDILKSVIRVNKLTDFDGVTLQDQGKLL